MSHVPRRNLTLVIGLLEGIEDSDLTYPEYEALNHLLLSARLLNSALLARPVQDAGPTPETSTQQ